MTADIARVSYDQSREYRQVVRQQGRVTLEADENEAATIASEALRSETLDVVGLVGAPDTGYLPVSGKGASGVSVGPGTFYLSGWRLGLPAAIDLASQPDWLDQPPTTITSGNFLVALLVNEQTVCAVEDQALREIALGGPDTAARDRLMQHFLRLPLTGTTCAAGAALVSQELTTEGLTVDPVSKALVSPARLRVGFVPGQAATDPCTPAAAGGYLGADNQLIRVSVIDYDATAKTGTLLWGWNNASFMYRAAVVNPTTLQLINTPVDGEHAPLLNQPVEILHRQADLGDGNYIASAQGYITTVTTAYSFDSGQVGLTVPSDFPPTDPNPVFLRLWQAMVPFTLGQATALDDVSGLTATITGLTATIARTVPATQISLRPYWLFAVRPSTPGTTTPGGVYPLRYLEAGQPPDGPRQWIADLAMMAAASSGVSLLDNCLVPFLPLTQQQGCQCCGLTLSQSDVTAKGGLQTVLDSLAGTRSGLALQAGTYTLAAPLALTSKHNGLTLEACGGGTVILQASTSNLPAFAPGMIQLTGVSNSTLRGLTLQMPGAVPANSKTEACLGVLARAAPNLTVESCTFQFPAPASVPLAGYGILFADPTSGSAVRGCTFTGGGSYPSGSSVWGVWAPSSENEVATTLDGVEISKNTFGQLGIGVLCYAQLGFVRCTDNRVISCGSGFYFANSSLGATGVIAQKALAATDAASQYAAAAINIGLQAPLLAQSAANLDTVFAMLPSPPTAPQVADTLRSTLTANFIAQGTASFTSHATDFAALHPLAPGVAGAIAGTSGGTGVTGSAGTTGTISSTAPPASILPAGASDAIIKALAITQQIAINSAVASQSLEPVLHISGNDVGLASVPTGLSVPPVGISIVTSLKENPATVLLTANRVLTADASTVAGSILSPAAAAVTGNMFMQPQTLKSTVPAFTLYADAETPFEVTGNVIRSASLIVPPSRANPPPTANWDFLNAVG
jgi:hypothetical protein